MRLDENQSCRQCNLKSPKIFCKYASEILLEIYRANVDMIIFSRLFVDENIFDLLTLFIKVFKAGENGTGSIQGLGRYYTVCMILKIFFFLHLLLLKNAVGRFHSALSNSSLVTVSDNPICFKIHEEYFKPR